MFSRALPILVVLGFAAPAAAQVNTTVVGVEGPALAQQADRVRVSVGLTASGTSAVDGALLLSSGPYAEGATEIARFGPVAVEAGTRTLFDVDVNLPAGALGVHWFVVQLDPDRRVEEPNELDDVGVSGDPISIVAPAARLRAADVAVSPARSAPGASITLTGRVDNSGRLPASLPVAVVVSRDAVISETDRELLRVAITVPGGGSVSVDESFALPADLGAGAWFVGLLPDPDGALASSSGDRAAASPSPITVVSPNLELLTRHLPDAVLGEVYGLGMVARGGDGTHSFELDGTLPAGLGFADGELSGTAREAGSFPLTLRVRSAGSTAEVGLTLEVVASGETLGIVTSTLALGFADRPYVQRLLASGGTPPYQWTLVDGELPVGIELESSGQLRGQPDEFGSSRFTVSVSDAAGDAREAEFGLVVSVTPDVFILTDRIELVVGAPAELSMEAVGGVRPLRWAAETPLAPGLTLSGAGVLSGTPTRIGSFPFRVVATDATDAKVSGYGFVELVVGDDGALMITSGQPPSVVALTDLSHQLEASGGTEPYAWRVVPGEQVPDGFNLTPDGHFYGRPRQAGITAVTFRVEDAVGRSADQTVALQFEPRPALKSSGCAAVAPQPDVWSLLAGLGLALALRRRRAARQSPR